jgi:hypothetical protein
MGSIEQVIISFKDSVNVDNNYSLKELQKLLEVSYKKIFKTKGSSSADVVKKAPSAYNIFIKEEIARMKQENKQGVDPKDFMKLAAQKWQEHKSNA